MKKRPKKVYIRKSDIKAIMSYNSFDEEVRFLFSKRIVKHYPKYVIVCSTEVSEKYTRWFKSNEDLEEGITELMKDLEDKTTEFITVETVE